MNIAIDANTHQLVSCYNCNVLQHRSKMCIDCGVKFSDPVYPPSSNSPKGPQYVFHTSQDDVNADMSDVVFSFPEVEITPSSLEQLLENYSNLLEQLKANGCLFYSIMYNPKLESSDVKCAGIPEEIRTNISETVKIYFPKSAKKRQKPRVYSEIDVQEKKYPCTFSGCDYRTKYSWQVKNHMRRHTGEKPYSCNFCNFRTSDCSRLIKHKRAHNLDTPFKCKICSLGFRKENGLTCHMRFVHKENDTESNSTKHMALYDESTGKWKCEICGSLFSAKSVLLIHYRTHTGERPYACGKCAYRASHRSSLRIHMNNHVDMDSKALSCQECSFRTNYYAILGQHNKQFHPKTNSCPETSAKLQNAPKRVVKHKGPWKCQICHIETGTRAQLKQHRKDHHNEQVISYMRVAYDGEKKVFNCKKCKFFSSDVNDSVQHSKKHMIRKISCNLCAYKTMSMASLNRHKAQLHGIKIAHNCPQCSFTCQSIRELNKHKKTHELSIPQLAPLLLCTKCTFSTSSQQLMASHMNCHNGVSFTCDLCNYMVYDESELILHKKFHLQSSNKKSEAKLMPKKKQYRSFKRLAKLTDEGHEKPEGIDASVTNILRSLDKKGYASLVISPNQQVNESLPEKAPIKMPKLLSLLNPGVNLMKANDQALSENATASSPFSTGKSTSFADGSAAAIMSKASDSASSIVVKTCIVVEEDISAEKSTPITD